MKTIFAHLKKDLILLRILLWIWVVFVGFDCLGFLDRIAIPHATGNAGLAVIAGLTLFVAGGVASFAFQLLLLLLLIVRVIHADPLTESDAFWRTRPISRAALLAEKAFFIALLFAGAVLAVVAVRFHSGNSSGVAMLLQALAFVSGLMAFSAITSNFSKLIVTFIFMALGAGVLASIITGLERFAVSMGIEFFRFSSNGHGLGLSNSEQFWLPALYLSGFVGVVICQYLTLRTNVSRAALFATLFLAALLQG